MTAAAEANTVSKSLLTYVDEDAKKDPQPLEQLVKIRYTELPRAMQADAEAGRLVEALEDDRMEAEKILSVITDGHIDELGKQL